MSIHQTYLSCSSSGSVEVLYLFEAIRNLRWLSWHLICRDIFIFLSRITVCEVSRLARDVPLELKKYCFSERFKVQQCCLAFNWPRRIWIFLLKNYFIWSHQTCHKFCSWGSEEVLLLFGVNRHPRWHDNLRLSKTFFISCQKNYAKSPDFQFFNK